MVKSTDSTGTLTALLPLEPSDNLASNRRVSLPHFLFRNRRNGESAYSGDEDITPHLAKRDHVALLHTKRLTHFERQRDNVTVTPLTDWFCGKQLRGIAHLPPGWEKRRVRGTTAFDLKTKPAARFLSRSGTLPNPPLPFMRRRIKPNHTVNPARLIMFGVLHRAIYLLDTPSIYYDTLQR